MGPILTPAGTNHRRRLRFRVHGALFMFRLRSLLFAVTPLVSALNLANLSVTVFGVEGLAFGAEGSGLRLEA